MNGFRGYSGISLLSIRVSVRISVCVQNISLSKRWWGIKSHLLTALVVLVMEFRKKKKTLWETLVFCTLSSPNGVFMTLSDRYQQFELMVHLFYCLQ